MEYKWKDIGTANVLVAKRGSQTAVATFWRAKRGLFSSSRPACLSIAPQGVHIVDEIVTTAVWFEERRRRRQQKTAA